MRVKVGGTWYRPGVGQPVMVEFNGQDKINIQNMDVGATKYAVFANAEDLTDESMFAWMEDGGECDKSVVVSAKQLDEILKRSSNALDICRTCEGDGTVADGLDEAAVSTWCPACDGLGCNVRECFAEEIHKTALEKFPEGGTNIYYTIVGDVISSYVTKEPSHEEDLRKLVDMLGPRYFLEAGWFPESINNGDEQ